MIYIINDNIRILV